MGVLLYGLAITGGILELQYLVLPPDSRFSTIVILSHLALILVLGFFSVLPCSTHSEAQHLHPPPHVHVLPTSQCRNVM